MLWLLLTFAFAAFVAIHVVLSARLVAHRPRLRALAALLLLPLAPYYGWGQGWRRWTVAWLVAAALYAVALTVALR